MEHIHVQLAEFYSSETKKIDGYFYKIKQRVQGLTPDLEDVAISAIGQGVERKVEGIRYIIDAIEGPHPEEICKQGKCIGKLHGDMHQRFSRKPSPETIASLQTYFQDDALKNRIKESYAKGIQITIVG